MPKSSGGDIDKQIGANLARMRGAHGLTQLELGAALSVPISPQAIEKYERGKSRIPASSLVEFAAHLKCGVSELLDGVEAIIGKERNGNGFSVDRRTERHMKDFHNLPSPALQDAVKNLTHALVMELAANFRKMNHGDGN